MAEISLHCQAVPGWLNEWQQTLGVQYVKVIDPPDAPFCNARVIARTFLDDNQANDLARLGKEGGRLWYERWLPTYERCSYVHAWEFINEPQPIRDKDFRILFVQANAEFNRLMHQKGLRTVALNLGVGHPGEGDAPDLLPALAEADYAGFHEYSAPTMQSGESWYCLRYRRTVEELHGRCPPILIGECGIDGGVLTPKQPDKGWRTFAAPDQYLSQLTWYRDELAKDGIVESAFVFTSEPVYPPWYDFGVDQALAMRFPRPVVSQIPVPPVPVPVPVLSIMRLPFAGAFRITSDFAAHRARTPPSTAPGIDYALPTNTPVLAAADGQVSGVRWSARGGLSIYVNHGDGLRSYYAHLRASLVGVSQMVKRGQAIAQSGNTGASTGSHLHFSTQRNGAWINPALLLAA